MIALLNICVDYPKMNYLMFLLELRIFLGRSHGKTPVVRILSHIKNSNASMQTAALGGRADVPNDWS